LPQRPAPEIKLVEIIELRKPALVIPPRRAAALVNLIPKAQQQVRIFGANAVHHFRMRKPDILPRPAAARRAIPDRSPTIVCRTSGDLLAIGDRHYDLWLLYRIASDRPVIDCFAAKTEFVLMIHARVPPGHAKLHGVSRRDNLRFARAAP